MSSSPVIYRLIRHGFDSLENYNPRYSETVGLFLDQPGSLATDRIEAYKADYALKHPQYRGWDGQIYPQWSVVQDPLL